MQMRWWVPLLLLLALGAACAESIEEKTQRCFAVSYTQEAAKNYAGAITALADAPDSYVVELRLGWLHYLKGNYTSAETHYKAAVKKNADALEAKVGYLLPLLALRVRGRCSGGHTCCTRRRRARGRGRRGVMNCMRRMRRGWCMPGTGGAGRYWTL